MTTGALHPLTRRRSRPRLDPAKSRRRVRLAQMRLAPAGARRLLRGDRRGARRRIRSRRLRQGAVGEGRTRPPPRLLPQEPSSRPAPPDHAPLGLDPARWHHDHRAEGADPSRGAALCRKSDGGWCLPSLGHWKRRDGKPNDPASPSDGYATGLVVFVLREAGVPAAEPAIQRGVAWLKANQRVRAAGSPARSTTMRTITSPTPGPASPCWPSAAVACG